MRRLLLGLLAVLGGCGSVCTSPECRIQAYPDMYDNLPEDVKERISMGAVQVGDTPQMVFLAMGSPSETRDVQTENGTVTQWVYGYEAYMAEDVIGEPYDDFIRPENGTMETYPYSYFRDERMVRSNIEYQPGMIVEFKDNRVSGFQRLDY